MPRKKLIKSSVYPYHITARVNNREAFPGDLESIWNILCSELNIQITKYGLFVHAFVLMPNHYHLIVSSPITEIGTPIREFQSSSTRILNTKYQRWGRIYGSRYNWSLITEPSYYFHALKYVYRNPIKANLCEEISNYKYSTAHGLLGYGKLQIPLNKPMANLDLLLPNEPLELETWLNQEHSNEENNSVKAGLRRKIFKLPVRRNNRKASNLLYSDTQLTHPPHQK